MSFTYKKKFSLILLIISILSIFSLNNKIFAEENRMKKVGIKKITILHTTDMHGRILEEDGGMGFGKLNTKIVDMKKENPNTILLDSGDAIQGSEVAKLSKGESIIKLLNAMEYDVMAVGNHEFDYGYERLLEIKDMANFPMISGNISNEYGKKDFKPYIIKEVDGIKIGIFSVVTPDTQYSTCPKNIEGITFLDPTIATREIVRQLKDKEVDMIVGLTHIGISKRGNYSSIDIAKNVKGIDLIIDGHSHEELDKGLKVGNTLIVQSGKYTENLGIVDIRFLGSKIISKKARLFGKDEAVELEEDKEIKKLIDEIIEENKQKSAEVTEKPREKTYIVKPGDVLFKIGKKYSVGWSEIAKYNGIKNPNKIYPGDRIKIPVKKL